MTQIEVLGIDHIDLTVNQLERSTAFYDKILTALGFRRLTEDAGQARWANAHLSFAIRPARDHTPFDRYRPGLHHLAFKARSRTEVDEFHRFLVRERIEVLDPPAEYPEYGPSYYAVFFADPDAIKLELVHFPWGYWRRVQDQGHDERPRRARS